MSSIIKKKGALSFKPKPSQTRKQPGATTSTNSSTCQSIDRRSQTPALVARPPVPSPSPELEHFQRLVDAQSGPQHATDASSPQNLDLDDITNRDYVPENTRRTTQGAPVEEISDVAKDKSQGPALPEQTELVTEDEATRETTRNISPDATIPSLFPNLATTTANSDSMGTLESESLHLQAVPMARYDDLSTLGVGESVRPSHLIPIAQLNPDGTSNVTVTKTKRLSKRRRLDKNSVDVRPTIEVPIHKGGLPGLTKPRRRRAKGAKKKKREVTPEDAEEQEIDPMTVTMSDLTKDLRIGKKSSKHDEIRKKHTQKRKRAKLARDHPEMNFEEGDEHGQSHQDSGQGEAPPETSTGPQMRLVNGQIVIDDRSLVVDRHKRAAATAPIMEEIEENELTHVITSGTYLRREKNASWTNEDNEKFYNALRMMGTDFEMISKMFPNRNRRQIKLKFNKEERDFPEKIATALSGEKIEINLEEYKSHTGRDYEEIAVIETERQQMEVEHNAEQQKMQAQADEMTRRKKATIQSSADTATIVDSRETRDAESTKENEVEGGKAGATSKPKKKPTAKKKRNIHSSRGGGEEVEVLGTIDELQILSKQVPMKVNIENHSINIC